MSEEKRTVLITGANGFVGARLCRYFIQQQFHVIAGVRKNSDLSQLRDLPVEYRYGDVTDRQTLPPMVSGVDYIIHNAGIVKTKSRRRFFEVNEEGTRAVMEAVSASNPSVRKVVYISSLAAVGPSEPNTPLTEETAPHPVTTYGQSKLAGERVMLSFKSNLPVALVRPSGVYGPGDKEVFSVFQTADRRIKAMIGDMSRKIQMIYVDDLCRGVFLATTRPTESGAAYFMAEKTASEFRDWVAALERAVGKKGFPLRLPGPVFRLIAAISGFAFKLVNATPMLTAEKANELLASWEVSIEKAKRELGFEPKVDFEEGAAITYQWYKQEGWL